jgi:hypothetical protein
MEHLAPSQTRDIPRGPIVPPLYENATLETLFDLYTTARRISSLAGKSRAPAARANRQRPDRARSIARL